MLFIHISCLRLFAASNVKEEKDRWHRVLLRMTLIEVRNLNHAKMQCINFPTNVSNVTTLKSVMLIYEFMIKIYFKNHELSYNTYMQIII